MSARDKYRVIDGKGNVITATEGMAMPHVYRMEDVCPWLCPWLTQAQPTATPSLAKRRRIRKRRINAHHASVE